VNASVVRVVRCAVAQHLNVDSSQIRLRDRIGRDLGLQEVDVGLIAVQIEETEGVEIPADNLAGVRTVRELAELLYNVLSSGDCRRPPMTRVAPPSARPATALRPRRSDVAPSNAHASMDRAARALVPTATEPSRRSA
jgi:acyl carrier protein